jgi:inhibitor of cysteine peptidase
VNAWSQTTTASAHNNVYTEDKLGVMVTKDHPEFQIKLKGNPSTGYMWFLREYNSNLVIPVKRVIVPAETKMMGAPSFELWTFKVKPEALIVPQQTMLRFNYSRPWDVNDQPKQVAFRVSVN